MFNHPLLRLLRFALEKYQRDDCTSLAAALAYFALFSFFPLILVVISLVGFFVDPDAFAVRQQLVSMIGSPEVRELVTQTLEQFGENRVNAGLLGFATLLVGAAGIFGALDRAFDVIWEVRRPDGGGLRRAVRVALRDRLVAFALVLGLSGLMLVAVLANFALGAVDAYTGWLPRRDLLRGAVQLLVTLLLVAVAMAAIFKVMPGRRAAWGDVWAAALVTSGLLVALQAVAGLIFARISFSSYGAVGGVMTLLLWIFLCCQVVLVGGELSYAWARLRGSLRGLGEGSGG